MRRYTPWIFLAAAYAVVMVAVQSCAPEDAPAAEPAKTAAPLTLPPAPTGHDAFVGAASCVECHEKEHSDWEKSHHHAAMLVADEKTVLGDFDDATFEHFGHTWRFFRKDGGFFVNAEDADGTRKDFEVAYTFGIEPLQQYLIPFPGGRYQALQVCWDTRPASEGGQRWYHLYPDEEIAPGDELHWTGPNFNWNYMCADCHSTRLDRNYDPKLDIYNTTYSEVNVSCEACHGPGADHVKWAKSDQTNEFNGIYVALKEPGDPAGWTVNPVSGQPVRTRPLEQPTQVESCARCHSHRRPLETLFVHGRRFADTHALTPITEALYHEDGQIDEESYVHGSFVQSKMFHAGVRCTDCHDPHTANTYFPAEDNRLCVRCHTPATYDNVTHHHHEVGTPGASCVNCHMAGKDYMGHDFRRDHSFRIPRPDLAAETGSRDACATCHSDKPAGWTGEQALALWGDKLTRHPQFGTAFASGETAQITAIATAPSWPAIARAGALSRLNAPSPETLALLKDSEPIVRTSTIALFEAVPPRDRTAPLKPLLQDDFLSVRTEAARLLAADASIHDDPAFTAALVEYREALAATADRAGGRMGQALLETDLGDIPAAEAAYRAALTLDPRHIPAAINLAELLQSQGRAADAKSTLQQSLKTAPTNSLLQESLGRVFIREKNYETGLTHILLAADLDPERAPIQFFAGVALNSLGRFPEAIPYLTRAVTIEPNNLEYLSGFAAIARDNNRPDLQERYTLRLRSSSPTRRPI